MKKLLLILITSILLKATGPSYVDIRLTPIATHEHGEVLFRTYKHINGMGAKIVTGLEIGWLVVSVKGIWDEQVAFVGDENTDDTKKIVLKLNAYREGKINLKSPDAILKKLMFKYNFTEETPLILEKFKRLELKPKQSCFMGTCIDEVLTQRTVEGYVSEGVKSAIKGFYYKGVVLFSNELNDEEYRDDTEPKGALFVNLPPVYWEEHDLGYDIVNIDGLVILSKEQEKKFKRSGEFVMNSKR